MNIIALIALTFYVFFIFQEKKRMTNVWTNFGLYLLSADSTIDHRFYAYLIQIIQCYC